jgi:hypothetical protein
MKNHSTSPVLREMKTRATVKYHFIPIHFGQYFNLKIQRPKDSVAKWEDSDTAGGTVPIQIW